MLRGERSGSWVGVRSPVVCGMRGPVPGSNDPGTGRVSPAGQLDVLDVLANMPGSYAPGVVHMRVWITPR